MFFKQKKKGHNMDARKKANIVSNAWVYGWLFIAIVMMAFWLASCGATPVSGDLKAYQAENDDCSFDPGLLLNGSSLKDSEKTYWNCVSEDEKNEMALFIFSDQTGLTSIKGFRNENESLKFKGIGRFKWTSDCNGLSYEGLRKGSLVDIRGSVREGILSFVDINEDSPAEYRCSISSL